MQHETTIDRIHAGRLPTDGTLAAGITGRLIRHAAQRGHPAGPLLAEVGWPSLRPPSVDDRVPLAQHWAVWRRIHSVADDDFGISFGASFELDDLGVLGLLMRHSPTLEAAVERQRSHQRLLIDHPFRLTRLEPTELVIEHPVLPIARELPHMMVAGLGFWVRLVRSLIGRRVHAARVELPHPPVAPPERYRDLFGVRPTFDAPRILLSFDRALWTAPVRAAPLEVEAYLRARAHALLQRLPTRGERLDRAREYIADQLHHGRRPTLSEAAACVGCSARTLQRRLSAADTTYEALLDQTRRGLALQYLQDERLAIGEVAVAVGYSEPATFYRAFRRWTGMPPGAYRASRPGLGSPGP